VSVNQLPLRVRDLVPTVVTGVVGMFGTHGASHVQGHFARHADALAYILVAVAALSLLGWRRRPRATLVISATTFAIYLAIGYPFGPMFLSTAFAILVVAADFPLERVAVLIAASAAVIAVAPVRQLTYSTGVNWSAAAAWGTGWTAVVLAATAIGTAYRVRRDAARQIRSEQAHRAASEERLRMAQDLHDSVGHGLAVIAMQSGVALHVLDREPAKARTSLEAIRATSRASLDELRDQLDSLRYPDDEATRRPAHGLADLAVLVDRVRAAGVVVALSVDPDVGRECGPEVATTVYRIAQEALTNALRHADQASVEVTVRRSLDGLVVQVADRGPGVDAARLAISTGTGIRGMRQRAEAIGGHFDAGPRDGGGFVVRAVLPLAVTGRTAADGSRS
jgi:signal transduction histidine kinase